MLTLSTEEVLGLSIQGFGAMQKLGEIEKLFNKVQDLYRTDKDCVGKILEVGCGVGGTSWLWSKLPARVFAVDLPAGPWGGGMEIEKIEYIKRYATVSYDYHAGNSHDQSVVDYIKRLGPFDLVFIDGDHSYEGVKKDYLNYGPMARKGGLVAFHDICAHPEETGCEVEKFWTELVASKDIAFEEFIEEPAIWGGIGAIKV